MNDASQPPLPALGSVAESDEILLLSPSFTNTWRLKCGCGGAEILGMFYVLIGSFAFAVMALFVNMLGSSTPSFQQVSVRFAIQTACAIAAIVVARRGKLNILQTWAGQKKNRRLLLIRGVWGTCGMASFYYALSTGRLADVAVVIFLNVPLTGLLARVILKEPYSVLDGVTGILCMCGVLFMAQPPAIFGTSGEMLQPMSPLLIGICLFGAFAASMAIITIRQLGSGEDSLVVVLFFSVFGIVLGPLGWLIFQSDRPWVLSADVGEAVMVVVIGLTGFFGQVFLSRGLQIAPAGPASAMRYSEVVFALVFQSTILSSPPNGLKLVGVVLVMSCIVAVYANQRRKARLSAAARTVSPAAPSTVAISAPVDVLETVEGVAPLDCIATDTPAMSGGHATVAAIEPLTTVEEPATLRNN